MRCVVALIAVALSPSPPSLAATSDAEQVAEGAFQVWAFPDHGDLESVACDVEPDTMTATCYGLGADGIVAARSVGDGSAYVAWWVIEGHAPADDVFVMDGQSMMTTLHHEDELRVQPGAATVERGDIVVLHQGAVRGSSERLLVKRVIALPGETIEMRNCIVTIDGQVLDEPYLDEHEVRPDDCGPEVAPTVILESHVFVMGDNRDASQDSRSSDVGQIAYDDIVGVVGAVRAPGGDWQPIDG